MPRRLDKTLADYMVLAISPALIIAMVMSLTFFLVEVLYQGDFEGRANWVMFCYSVAIVLIARISMEEGAERAGLFALPLAVAMWLVLGRFGYSSLPTIAVLGIVWWAAHQLTWDSTFIDERVDASGQGLLQVVGIDREGPQDPDDIAPAVEKAAPSPPTNKRKKKSKQEPAAVSEIKAALPPAATSLWNRFQAWRERRRAKHTPGIWAVYFSLAALPMFGIGQAFMPALDMPRRQYVFKLVLIYLAAGLGLLLTTSFLGLRRYLRQRKVEMPRTIAGAWLGTGAALAVALLVAAMLIPRPNAEYAISRLSGSDGSTRPRANRVAVLRDSPAKGPGAASNQPAPGQPATGPNGANPGQGNTQGPSSGQSGPPGQNSPGGTSGSKSPGGSSSGQQPGGSGQSNSQSSSDPASQGKPAQGNSEQGSSAQGKPAQGNPEQGQPANGSKDSSNPSPSKGESPSKNENGQPSSNGQPPTSSPPPEKGTSPGQGNKQDSANKQDGANKQEGANKQDGPAQQQPANNTGAKPPSGSAAPSTQTPPAAAQAPSPSPSFQLPDFSGGLTMLFRWALNIALAITAIWLIWKYWATIQEYFRQLIAALRALWTRLFVNEDLVDQPNAANEPAAPRHPFAAYGNPFTTGLASRYTPNQLVCYSFAALQAWGEEQDCPRSLDSTPLEFATRLGRIRPDLADDSSQLAQLFSQAVYGGEVIRAEAVTAMLPRLWTRLVTQPPMPPNRYLPQPISGIG